MGIRYKVERKQANAKNDWLCKECQSVFRTRADLFKHRKDCHNTGNQKYQIVDGKRKLVEGTAWNKGLTKEDSITVANAIEKRKETYVPWNLGKKESDEHRNAISAGMKIAHQERRAHNIGESRWNNEHSWPEKWFIQVLLNEFKMVEHEHYETEMPFDRYSLDFAWPKSKLCIEIDGEQHERFEDYKLRDNKKDKLLLESGWQVFRIKWKDCWHNPKQYIDLVRNKFIELHLI